MGEVLARYDVIHAREVALYLSWLAVAYADANEPEAAAPPANGRPTNGHAGTDALSLEENEHQAILRALERAAWVKKNAADLLCRAEVNGGSTAPGVPAGSTAPGVPPSSSGASSRRWEPK